MMSGGISDEARAQMSAMFERQRLALADAYRTALAESARLNGPQRAHSDAILLSYVRHYEEEAAQSDNTQLAWICDVIEGRGVTPALPPWPPQTLGQKLGIVWQQARTTLSCGRSTMRHAYSLISGRW
jgi:hypothetical protein